MGLVSLGINWAMTKIDSKAIKQQVITGGGINYRGWTGGAVGGRVRTNLRLQCLDLITDSVLGILRSC